MNKDDYIKLISDASSRHGDKLLDMMDRYRASNLHSITEQEAKEFWQEISGDCPAVENKGNKNEINKWCSQSKYIADSEQSQHCEICKLKSLKQNNDIKNKFYED